MTTLNDTEIKYQRDTKDYDVIVAGEYIGSAKTYREAEQLRTAAIADHLHLDPADYADAALLARLVGEERS